MTDFVCNECKVKHDFSTREGLIDTIAHQIYHARKGMSGENMENNRKYAVSVVEWFEKTNRNSLEWHQKIDDYEQFAGYYKEYYLNKMRG